MHFLMKAGYRIKPYAHERLKWVVRGKENGKWVRKYFEKKLDAETFAQQKNTELLNQGMEGVSFPSWLRVMAQREQGRLQPYNKTLTDAVDFYLKHLEGTTRSVSIAQGMTELIANRKSSGASKQYCADLHWRISRFIQSFPDRTVAEITTRDIDDWLAGLGLAPVTRNTFRRDVRTLFSFCATRKYCPDNPAIGTRRAKEIDGEIEILSVAQTRMILERSDKKTLPYWAIGAFAGLRSAEIERLEWREVNLAAGLIEVKASKSKTASRRLVTMQPNLRTWLAPYNKHHGPVCPIGLRKMLEKDRRVAGFGTPGTETDEEKERDIKLTPWPSNALRHSFGSYHLAEFKDAAALALQMGNSPTMIFKHYRELVKPKDAAQYWNIRPVRQKK